MLLFNVGSFSFIHLMSEFSLCILSDILFYAVRLDSVAIHTYDIIKTFSELSDLICKKVDHTSIDLLSCSDYRLNQLIESSKRNVRFTSFDERII